MSPARPVDPPVPCETVARHDVSETNKRTRRTSDVALRIMPLLDSMLRAYEYAQDIECETWEFAVEIRELLQTGLNQSDLRWLVKKGFIEHGRDVTGPSDESRVFRRERGLVFTKRTCFVLTPRGASYFRELRSQQDERRRVVTLHATSPASEVPGAPHVALPHWDRDRQELRIGNTVVKQFKVPAPNQEMIIAAFDEEGWPPRIDDPLPPHPQQDPKRRLHDTINSLNRNQRVELIRFLGDGSGQGVRWERADRQ